MKKLKKLNGGKIKCFKCDHEWYSRKTNGEKPVQCPNCKRTDYSVERYKKVKV